MSEAESAHANVVAARELRVIECRNEASRRMADISRVVAVLGLAVAFYSRGAGGAGGILAVLSAGLLFVEYIHCAAHTASSEHALTRASKLYDARSGYYRVAGICFVLKHFLTAVVACFILYVW